MNQLSSVCVFCGSRSGSNPIFEEQSYILGRLLAEAGVRLVYGGGNVGLMGAVARGALDNGGAVCGIIPRFLAAKERIGNSLDELDEAIITDNMHERKMLTYEKADAFVALPGGIGTLEELVEQLTWAQLGQHQKPIILANFDQFWQPLLTLLAHMSEQSFLYNMPERALLTASTAADILPQISAALVAGGRPVEPLPIKEFF